MGYMKPVKIGTVRLRRIGYPQRSEHMPIDRPTTPTHAHTEKTVRFSAGKRLTHFTYRKQRKRIREYLPTTVGGHVIFTAFLMFF